MPNFPSFFAGFLGGMCPTVAKAAGYAAVGDIPPLASIVSAGLFGVLGGAVGYYLSDGKPRTAFVAGISAPAIISGLLAGATQGGDSPLRSAYLRDVFSVAAYAQAIPLTPISPEGYSTITLTTEFSGYPVRSADLIIGGTVGATGDVIEFATVPLAPGQSVLNVPSNISQLTINGQVIDNFDMGAVTINVETAATFWGDVLWGLGGERNYGVTAINVTPMLDVQN